MAAVQLNEARARTVVDVGTPLTHRQAKRSTEGQFARPFLKWVGGKGKLLPQLINHLPSGQLRYGEVFLGGGALYFHLQGSRRLQAAVIGDLSTDVHNAHNCVRDHTDALLAALHVHETAYLAGDEDQRAAYFYKIRALHPDIVALTPVQRAARMLFLNRTCFNGLWRENAKGAFNCPHGKYAEPKIADDQRLYAAAQALADAVLVRADFRQWPELCRRHALDTVYLDPPYHPLTATSSFNAYSGGSFSAQSQRELAEMCGELDKLGVRWVLSNSDCAVVRELYRPWHIATIRAARSINSKGSARGEIDEVVVSNRRPGLNW